MSAFDQKGAKPDPAAAPPRLQGQELFPYSRAAAALSLLLGLTQGVGASEPATISFARGVDGCAYLL
jgi:hypothetical protein